MTQNENLENSQEHMELNSSNEDKSIEAKNDDSSINSVIENNDMSSYQEDKTQYKEGQILQFVKVRFPGNSKTFPFAIGKRKLDYGKEVVAMSDRGMAVGYINSFPYEAKIKKNMMPIKSIMKLANEKDIQKDKENFHKEDKAREICRELVDKHKLDMELTHVEYIQFGKKAVFYFTAPARIDFRELVKDLVAKLKMRIELRQITVRDRAAALGGLGPCGRQLCCNSFLEKYGNVGIKMAKNQNLTFSPTKLNGVCGQLKCCIQYEDEVYTHKRKSLPEVGKYLKTKNGDTGRVERIHILSEQFELLTDQGILRKYTQSQFIPGQRPPENWKFPASFDHISDERSNLIGEILIKEPGPENQKNDNSFDQFSESENAPNTTNEKFSGNDFNSSDQDDKKDQSHQQRNDQRNRRHHSPKHKDQERPFRHRQSDHPSKNKKSFQNKQSHPRAGKIEQKPKNKNRPSGRKPN